MSSLDSSLLSSLVHTCDTSVGSPDRHALEQTQNRQTFSPTANGNINNYNVKNNYVNESCKYNNDAALIIFRSLHDLWKKERLCDVILKTNGGDVLAHKMVLAAYSDSYMVKFDSPSHDNKVTIKLNNINERAAQQVVNFLYTNQLYLNETDVLETLSCANQLGIGMVISRCIEYIKQSINPHNVIQFLNYAKIHAVDIVMDLAINFILRNITKMHAKDQGKLPIDVLITVINSDNLIVHNEADVFDVIVNWVDNDRAHHLNQVPQLLKFVRYNFISPEQVVKKVEPIVWLFESRVCHEWLCEVMRYHIEKSLGRSTYSYATQNRRTHSPPHDELHSPNSEKISGS